MRGFKGWLRAALIAAALCLPFACSTSGGNDGETHFVRCASDGDCRDSGPGLTCVSGRCVDPTRGAGGAGGTRSASGGNAPDAGPRLGDSGVPDVATQVVTEDARTDAPKPGELRDGSVRTADAAPKKICETGLADAGPECADGALVRYEFTATVTHVDPTAQGGYDLPLGAQIAGVLAFEARSPATAGVRSVSYEYAPGASRAVLQLHAPGLQIATSEDAPDGTWLTVGVQDDFLPGVGASLRDDVYFGTTEGVDRYSFGERIEVSLDFSTTTRLDAISSLRTPTGSLDLSRMEGAALQITVPSLLFPILPTVTATVTAFTRVEDSAPKCGDGLVDPGEQCDDFNDVDGDGCDSCRFSCIPGSAVGGCGAPSNDCTLAPTCSDRMHRCLPGVPVRDLTPCSSPSGGVCWAGTCTALSGDLSRYVTLSFSGTVSGMNPASSKLLAIGEPFTGEITYDATQPDTDPGSAVGNYELPDSAAGMVSLHAEVGPVQVVSTTSPSGHDGTLTIENGVEDVPDPARDSWNAFVVGIGDSAHRPLDFSLSLTSRKNASAITTDALLLDPPPLSAFESRQVELRANATGGSFYVIADLTSLTRVH